MAQDAKHTGYRIDLRPPHDGQIKTRNRFFRLMWFLISTGFIIGAPTALVGYWGLLIGHETIGYLLGFCGGGTLARWIIPDRMLIYNPEWTGYVTQNMFTGTMIPYGPGLHLSHWWEERNKNGNYSLKVITRPFSVGISTQSAKVIVGGKFEYAIDLALIERAIGVDASTIESGITAFIDSFLTSQCAQMDAGEVRKQITELNEKLSLEFMSRKEGGKDPISFGSKYGFITVSVVIDSIAFPSAVQKTRDAIDEAEVLHEVVARLYGYEPAMLKTKIASGEISTDAYNKMLNRALTVSGNDTKMDITVVEGDIPILAVKLAEKFLNEKKVGSPKQGNKASRPTQGGRR
ncbi:MAG: hypothetical protein NT108_00470 [Candidatus Kaiserbacteria bacterium]|nr:hypothetical protein [Candidatus Kaiserbacteria bacterium]